MSYISIPKESNREGPGVFVHSAFVAIAEFIRGPWSKVLSSVGAGVRWLQAECNCDPGWMRAGLVDVMDTEGRGGMR